MGSEFIVAWINFFDNELHIQKVCASDHEEAIRKSDQDVISSDFWEEEDLSLMKNLQELAFDCDGMINVLEL